jgi:hypothetical protein
VRTASSPQQGGFRHVASRSVSRLLNAFTIIMASRVSHFLLYKKIMNPRRSKVSRLCRWELSTVLYFALWTPAIFKLEMEISSLLIKATITKYYFGAKIIGGLAIYCNLHTYLLISWLSLIVVHALRLEEAVDSCISCLT